MRHSIDPKIDCVFKALLGAEANRALLIHFLNAILGTDLPSPITDIDHPQPLQRARIPRRQAQHRRRQGPRLTRDSLYQIEIQLVTYQDLPARILYAWADLYSQQLQSGQEYGALRPTYSIWLLAEDLLRGDLDHVHRYRLRDDQGRVLLDHGGIWLLELNKFTAERIETEQQRWLKFLKEGERLDADALPEWMQTDEMRQAMSTLKAFSEKERAYHAYQARQNFLREQRSIQRELEENRAVLEENRAALEEARTAIDAERQAKETALAEIERLKTLLQSK